jgi:hypothetical protein
MRIIEIIDDIVVESISLTSTLKLLASDIGNPVTELYSKLESMAQKWAANNDSMRGFRLLEKGVISTWLNEEGQHLISHLHHLADQAPSQAASSLRYFLRDLRPTDINSMATDLVPILIQVSRDTNYEHLARNAAGWQQRDRNYRSMLNDLENYAKSDKKAKKKVSRVDNISDKYADKKDQEDAARKAALAKSRTQAEQLVNNVIRALPPKIAGEIRNAIARDDNKLVALKRELDRRNIKM